MRVCSGNMVAERWIELGEVRCLAKRQAMQESTNELDTLAAAH